MDLSCEMLGLARRLADELGGGVDAVLLGENLGPVGSIDGATYEQEYTLREVEYGDADGSTVLPVILHGDAAMAGQGVVYETMQMSQVDNYQTGGTVHIICNNQIGFTAIPEQSRSTKYCSDLGKTFACPIFPRPCRTR